MRSAPIRLTAALIGAASVLSAPRPAGAVSLEDALFTLDCAAAPEARARELGACGIGAELHHRIVDPAIKAAELWAQIHDPGAEPALESQDEEFVLHVLDPAAFAERAASARRAAEGSPALYDAGLQIIWVAARDPDEAAEAYDTRLRHGLLREIGLAILAEDPGLANILADDDARDLLAFFLEGFANFPNSLRHPRTDAALASRGFDAPAITAVSNGAGWGSAALLVEALRRSNPRSGARESDFLGAIQYGLTRAAETAPDEIAPEDVLLALDEAAVELGWPEDHPAGAFAAMARAAMASHQLNEARFRSEQPAVTVPVAYELNQHVEDFDLESYETGFRTIRLTGANLRETELVLQLCEGASDYDRDGCDQTVVSALLFEGDSYAKGAAQDWDKPYGVVPVAAGPNHIRLTLPSRREAGLGDGEMFEFRVAVANIAGADDYGYAERSRLIVSAVAREAPCTWGAMAATLNPWWRGDMTSPYGLTPTDGSLPADIRLDMSESLASQWYLTEEAYRADLGWDEGVFAGAAGARRLSAVQALVEDFPDLSVLAGADGLIEQDRIFRRLMPSAAELHIQGPLNLSGTVCVSPLTVQGTPPISAIPEDDPAAALAALGLPPELANIESEAEAMAAIFGNMDALQEAMSATGPVTLQIFSPNLWTQQRGMLPPATGKPLVHPGHGGWPSNAGFNLYVQLPGVEPAGLRPGQSYEAVGTVQFVGRSLSDPESALPFYVRSTGGLEEGEYEELIETQLRGRLTIDRQVAGAAIASLRLSGPTWRRDYVDRGPDAPDVEPAGEASVSIDRFLILGLVEDELLPVSNPFNLTTALIPAGE